MRDKLVLDAARNAAAICDLRHEVNQIGVEISGREDGLAVAQRI